MLKHRWVSLFFILILLIYGLLVYKFSFDIFGLLAILLIYSGILAWGSFYIGSQYYMPVVSKGKTDQKLLSITFDDGPHEKNTSEILRILKKYDATACFFIIGKNIQGREEIIKQLDHANHLLGNHSWEHSVYTDFLSKKKLKEEVEKTNQEIEKITGKKLAFFRPPFGITNPNIAHTIKALHMYAIGWNIRSLDTRSDLTKEKVIDRIKKRIKPGSIILLHDSTNEIGTILEELLIILQQMNYKVVPLDQLTGVKAYK
ncbi:MAG: polysaccharide deacetylase family protein [Marinilabiliales bacterium]|nr:MAG: polysaccharide deacetylase family protein [Marinilabiliales bacterium]